MRSSEGLTWAIPLNKEGLGIIYLVTTTTVRLPIRQMTIGGGFHYYNLLINFV